MPQNEGFVQRVDGVLYRLTGLFVGFHFILAAELERGRVVLPHEIERILGFVTAKAHEKLVIVHPVENPVIGFHDGFDVVERVCSAVFRDVQFTEHAFLI